VSQCIAYELFSVLLLKCFESLSGAISSLFIPKCCQSLNVECLLATISGEHPKGTPEFRVGRCVVLVVKNRSVSYFFKLDNVLNNENNLRTHNKASSISYSYLDTCYCFYQSIPIFCLNRPSLFFKAFRDDLTFYFY